jgi:hypothetical protein
MSALPTQRKRQFFLENFLKIAVNSEVVSIHPNLLWNKVNQISKKKLVLKSFINLKIL